MFCRFGDWKTLSCVSLQLSQYFRGGRGEPYTPILTMSTVSTQTRRSADVQIMSPTSCPGFRSMS